MSENIVIALTEATVSVINALTLAGVAYTLARRCEVPMEGDRDRTESNRDD